MQAQQRHKQKQLTYLFQRIINHPVQEPLELSTIEKILSTAKKQNLQHLLLTLLKDRIHKDEQVALRLKCLLLVHRLISSNIKYKIAEQANQILMSHHSFLKIKCQINPKYTTTNSYHQTEFQIPYINFLRKIVSWKMIEIAADDVSQIDIGFSLINKVQDILQLRIVFHHYGCYYPSHTYAINIFEACIQNIKVLWARILFNMKKMSVHALKNKEIAAEQYLFIVECQKTQESLLEFIYDSYFQGKIRKELRIKHILLESPQIKKLQSQRKKRQTQESAFKIVMTKRDLRKIVQKQLLRPTGSTSLSQQNDQKLNTQQQIQILQSILQLECLLNI